MCRYRRISCEKCHYTSQDSRFILYYFQSEKEKDYSPQKKLFIGIG